MKRIMRLALILICALTLSSCGYNSMVEKIKLVTNIIIVNFIKLEVLPIKPVI